MYVIGEYLFIENFLVNYAIFHITRIITRTTINRKRIILTSFITALYPFVLFIPSLIFLTNFYMKIILSMIIVKLAYNAKSFELYIKQLLGFYFVSFIFAGASIGIYYFIHSYSNFSLKQNDFSKEFPIKYLIIGIILGCILIKNIFNYYQGKVTKEKALIEVTIYYKNKELSLTSLVDTGNSLIEPLSKLPVFVVEYDVIKGLIPSVLKELYENKQEDDFLQIQNVLEELKEEIIIRLIPFKTIGSKSGVLLGFKPDYIEIKDNLGSRINDNLIIGIFNGKLSTDDQYRGLLNLEILNRGNISVSKN